MKPTEQQQAIIENKEDRAIVMARAGTGKSSTAVMFIENRPEIDFLYTVFNTDAKKDMELKVKKKGLKNVKVSTAHSVAFGPIVPSNGYEITPSLKATDIIEIIPLLKKKLKIDRTGTFILAKHIIDFYNIFLSSSEKNVYNLDPSNYILASKDYINIIQDSAKLLYTKMDKGEMPVLHDFYLKKFAHNTPVLNYDYIILDEGQDSNHVLADILLNQPSKLLILGDSAQNIYSFRNTVNLFDELDWPSYPLTESFRFHQGIADMANETLDYYKLLDPNYKNEYPVIGKAKKINEKQYKKDPLMHIGRTNGSLLDKAIDSIEDGMEYLHFTGSPKSVIFGSGSTNIYDIYNLYTNNKTKIRDPFISSIGSFEDLEDYIEDVNDREIGRLAKTVKRYKRKLPMLIKQLQESDTKYDRAEIGFATTFKSKGLGFSKVKVMSDHVNPEDIILEMEAVNKSTDEHFKKRKLTELRTEINTKYVAVTRGMQEVSYE